MKKTTLFLILSLLTFATSFAENIELTQAQCVAETLLRSKMGQMPDIHLINFANQSAFSHFYVFGNDNCFVIVSADDRVSPIIGFSTDVSASTRSSGEL